MAYSYCKSNSIACNAINISFVAFKVACFDAKNNQFVCYYFARSLPRSIFFFVSFTICAMWAHFIALLSLLWPGTHTQITLTHTHAHRHTHTHTLEKLIFPGSKTCSVNTGVLPPGHHILRYTYIAVTHTQLHGRQHQCTRTHTHMDRLKH